MSLNFYLFFLTGTELTRHDKSIFNETLCVFLNKPCCYVSSIRQERGNEIKKKFKSSKNKSSCWSKSRLFSICGLALPHYLSPVWSTESLSRAQAASWWPCINPTKINHWSAGHFDEQKKVHEYKNSPSLKVSYYLQMNKIYWKLCCVLTECGGTKGLQSLTTSSAFTMISP